MSVTKSSRQKQEPSSPLPDRNLTSVCFATKHGQYQEVSPSRLTDSADVNGVGLHTEHINSDVGTSIFLQPM